MADASCCWLPLLSVKSVLVALSPGVIDVHGRRVPHLLLGEVEPGTVVVGLLNGVVVDLGDGADRDGYFLAAEQVPLLQQHVGHVAAAGVDDQPLDLPDGAVGGVDALAAAHGYLAQGKVS